MPTTVLEPARHEPASAPASSHRRRWRQRIARLERPLLLAGLALFTAHLLDLSVSGPATTVLGVLVILALPAAWAFVQLRVTRPTRMALRVVVEIGRAHV